MACRHFNFVVERIQERKYVNSIQDNNCIECLINRLGPMTQLQVAEFLELSVARISQVEVEAIRKMKEKMKNDS